VSENQWSALELAMCQLPNILDCCVLERTDTSGAARLVAYVVSQKPLEPDDAQMLQTAAEVRGYDVDYVSEVPSLPLCDDGTVDRQQLSTFPTFDASHSEAICQQMSQIVAAPATLKLGRRIAFSPLHIDDVLAPAQDLPPTETSAQTADGVGAKSDAAAEGTPPSLAKGEPLANKPDYTTLVGALERAADLAPQTPLHFIDHLGRKTRLGYADLRNEALALLGGLKQLGLAPGDKVIFQFEDPFDFVRAFWACQFGGYVPASLPMAQTFSTANTALETLKHAWSLLEKPVILTSDALCDDVAAGCRLVGLADATVVPVSTLSGAAEAPVDCRAAGDVALLLFTSGSTGQPKAVQLTHDNIIARSLGTIQQDNFTPQDVCLNWMPLDHVGGIVMCHIRDVICMCSQVQVSKDYVLSDILRWLDLIDAYRATFTWAPNFAFALINDKAAVLSECDCDLSSMRFILNAGEAIAAPTARAFLKVLAPMGLRGDAMYPVWGMSETSSGITSFDRFRTETTSDDDPFVCVGAPAPDTTIKIVDDAGDIVPEGTVGRLFIQGPTVTQGYYANPDATAQVMHGDGWFETGDLGIIVEGRLTITGRLKNVLIVNGINYNCHEIEAVLDTIDGLETSYSAAMAYRPKGAQTDALAVFVVPTATQDRKVARVLATVRDTIIRSTGLTPDVIVPVDKGEIPKTSIGKIQHAKLRAGLEAGQFEAAVRRAGRMLGNSNDVPQWFLTRQWHRADARHVQPINLNGSTVIGFIDAQDDPATAADTVRQAGGRFISVLPGTHYAQISQTEFTIRPGHRGDIAAVLDAIGLEPDASLHVVYLWSHLKPAQHQISFGFHVWRGLCQELALWSDANSLPVTVTVLSRNAEAVTLSDRVDPYASLISGYARSAGQEHSGLIIQHIDVDTAEFDRVSDAVHWLQHPDPAGTLAYRGGKRFLPGLKPIAVDAKQVVDGDRLKRDGVYVITGGLGGVGVVLAEFLLKQYSANVILTGRRALDKDANAKAQFGKVSSLPGQAVYQTGDVISPHQMRLAVDSGLAALGRSHLDGIFHLTGAYEECSLLNETDHDGEAMIAPKVFGAESIEGILALHEDAFFVGFSSQISLFGAPMAGAYAAANQFIDSFAANLRTQGTAAYSVNWTLLGDLGVATKVSGADALKAFGLARIGLQQFLASMRIVLSLPPGQIAVGLDPSNSFIQQRFQMPCGAPELRVALRLESPSDTALEALPETQPDVFGTPIPVAYDIQDAAHQSGQDMSPSAEALAKIWRQVLRITDVSGSLSFFEAGGQSIMATELIAAIARDFGIVWSMRDVFEHSTFAEQLELIEQSVGHDPMGHDTVNDVTAGSAPTPVSTSALGLTPAQNRVYFLERLSGGVPMYNVSSHARFADGIDPQALEDAIAQVVAQHAALRARFIQGENGLCQVIEPHIEVPLEVVDLRDESAPQADALLAALITSRACAPYDLAAGPLLRTTLVLLHDGAAQLLVNLHHIITDGWSMRQFFDDLLRALKGTPLPTGGKGYEGYVTQLLKPAAHIEEDIAYWRERLRGVTTGSQLPTDRQRPDVESFKGAQLKRTIDARLSRQIADLCRQQNVSLFLLVLTVFKLWLSRVSGDSDCVVGSVAANREAPDAQDLIGFLINVIVLRTDLSGDPSLLEALGRVQATVLDAHAHARTPFETIVDALEPDRNLSRAPFFQIAFDVHDENMTVTGDDRIDLSVMDVDFATSKYDLHLTLKRSNGAWVYVWEYATDLFEASTIETLAKSFEAFLEAALAKPDSSARTMPLIDENVCAQLVNDFGRQPNTSYLDDATVIDLFERRAATHPHKPAVELGGETIDYQSLSARTDQVARQLNAMGVSKGEYVGVSMARSPDMVVAILAILKAGAAYVPFDPAYPDGRLANMLAQSKPALIVSGALEEERWAALVGTSGTATRVVTLATLVPETRLDTPEALGAGPDVDDLAYIIFTSGSTGEPKGVMVSHGGVTNLVRAQCAAFGIDDAARVLQFAAFGFDAAVSEIFTALCSGAALCFGDEYDIMPGPNLARFLRRERISVVTLPPSALRVTGPEDLPDLKTIVSAGEACPVDVVQRWGVGRTFINAYGPTENTVCVSMAQCDPTSTQAPTIGRPMANVETYVLGACGTLMPPGVPGELYVSGAGVARGYLGREDLTQQRFLDIQLPGHTSRRMYRTGDLVKWRSDGELIYLGRVDEQVKLRGYRIELEEIEAVLRSAPGVRDAAVAVEETPAGDPQLTAYVVAEQAGTNASSMAATDSATATRRPARLQRTGQLEFWPSLAEFFVYDELIYHMMTHDELRNDVYRAAINQVVMDKVVLDIGTGRDAILSRLAVAGGARHVYAVELMEETYHAAKATVAQHGLEDKITVIQGDASQVSLPEKADVCVSEIVGAIGGAEGSAKIINDAWRLMAPDGVMIPARSKTMIAAVSLPESMIECPQFSGIAAEYVEKIFNQVGRRFDLRLCLKNANQGLLRSSSDIFEDLDYTRPIALEDTHDAVLYIHEDGPIDGFLVWLKLETADGEWIDCLRNEHCWIPVFLPVFSSALDVQKGTRIDLRIIRTLCSNGLNPDFHMTGTLVQPDGQKTRFDYNCAHFSEGYRQSDFYQRLFDAQAGGPSPLSGDTPPSVEAAARTAAQATLPSFMHPSDYVVVDHLPLSVNGKLDRKALTKTKQRHDVAKTTMEKPRSANTAQTSSAVTPSGDLAAQILSIWTNLLGHDDIGPMDNFFDVGGNSIKMAELQALLEAHLDREVSLVALFQNPTIERMAKALSAPKPNTQRESRSLAEAASASADAGSSPSPEGARQTGRTGRRRR